jgi:VanZ family protein
LTWIGLIVLESTDLFSAAHTGSWLRDLIMAIVGPVSPAWFDLFHHVLRKTGHVIGYGILSFLLFRAWRVTLQPIDSAWALRWAAISFFMTAIVASLDELHQTFLPSRTGRVADVLLDSSAALAVQFLLWVMLSRRNPHPAPTIAAD